MVKLSHIVTLVAILALAMPHVSRAGRHSKDTDTNASTVTLNKHQLACVAVVLAEMRRRGWTFRGWQMIITDKGSYYEIAFTDDPLPNVMGGDGYSWDVRKRDLKLSGPTYYK